MLSKTSPVRCEKLTTYFEHPTSKQHTETDSLISEASEVLFYFISIVKLTLDLLKQKTKNKKKTNKQKKKNKLEDPIRLHALTLK